jgi:hypothetical protein
VHIVPQLLTVLRTAFLVYVRVLLFLQGLFLLFLVWAVFSGVPIAIVLLFSFLGLAQIVTALMLRRGRRWAAISAILIEVLWALVAAALGYKTLKDWPPLDLQALWQLTAVTALSLVTIFGLLVRPVRAYAGLVRR